MQVVYRRCAGLDVHKETITATVLVFDDEGRRQVRTKQFGTYWKQLQALAQWLRASLVEQVVMESTGVYWKLVWNVLEKTLHLVLANPYQVKNIPTGKTDRRDSVWLADLLAHGLVRSSFVPPQPIRHLRDLTRYRVQLTRQHTRVRNRIEKVLIGGCQHQAGDGGQRFDGRERARHAGRDAARSPRRPRVAGRLRTHYAARQAAGVGAGLARQGAAAPFLIKVLPHHLYLLGELMDELEFVERKMARVEAELTQRMQPYEEQVQRLCTIPGLDVLTAWTMLAEIGPDMSVFPDAAHAASWAGLCPGNRESAGKRLGSRMKKGNRWLRRALCQSAWAVTKKRNCFLTAFYYRQMARHGEKKAIMASAHRLLVFGYHMLRDRELDGDYYDRLRPERTANRLVRRLERLGMEVTLTPKVADPIPPAAPDGKRSRGRPCKCLERGIDCKHRRL